MAVYSKETALYEKGKVRDSIRNAEKKADNYVTDIANSGVFVHQNDGGSHIAPTASNARGVKISDTVEIIRNGNVMAEFGGGSGDEIILGNSDVSDYIVKIDSEGSTLSRINGSDEDLMYSYRAHETTGLITYEQYAMLRSDPSFQYNYVQTKFDITALSQVLYAAVIVDDNEVVVVENGEAVEGYYSGVYARRFFITYATFESITGHSAALQTDRVRIRFQANGTIYSAQMWLGNAVPEDDIRFQIAKDDNTPGFTVDKNGSVTAANILSGVTEEVTIASSDIYNFSIDFEKEFPSVPVVTCSLTEVSSNVHQLVAQLKSVTTTSASFSIRNNGSASRSAKISWIAIG